MTSNQTQLGGLYLGLTIYRDIFYHVSESMERLCNADYIVYVVRKPRRPLVGSILPHFIQAGVLAHGMVPSTYMVGLPSPVKCLL